MNASESTAGICVIIPAYRESGRIGRVVRSVRSCCPDVVVVDDGSDDATGSEAREAGATVLRQEPNMGKGAALERGVEHATGAGFECVITMDGDGQHAPEDIYGFVAAYREGRKPVLIGNRMANPDGMPFVRRMTNRYMSWLLSRRMGVRVPDTQCGYRLYRCDVVRGLLGGSERFAAESEVLLRLASRGVEIGSVPIRVIYSDEKSKINPFKDTVRFFRMLRRNSGNRA
ncbi:MAG: glycosyltransferase family 2 protein [Lentisphaerae bacterium]|nr:glycosyltransferase family 2 protein [Lentisphaerota bacterium]